MNGSLIASGLVLVSIVITGMVKYTEISIDAPLSEFREVIRNPGTASRLLLFVAGAIGLLVAVTRIKRAWALPVASLVIVKVPPRRSARARMLVRPW